MHVFNRSELVAENNQFVTDEDTQAINVPLCYIFAQQ